MKLFVGARTIWLELFYYSGRQGERTSQCNCLDQRVWIL